MTTSINEISNDLGVCRTAPATPSLLNISIIRWKPWKIRRKETNISRVLFKYFLWNVCSPLGWTSLLAPVFAPSTYLLMSCSVLLFIKPHYMNKLFMTPKHQVLIHFLKITNLFIFIIPLTYPTFLCLF